MPEDCGRRFDEALLSGYVDRALTQADDQRVRLHLEDCARCRAHVEDMVRLKEVTMSSRFNVPADGQWSEVPRGAASRLTLGLGWILVIVWLAAMGGLVLWEVATSGNSLSWKLLVFGGLSGAVLLLLSVLLDRLAVMKTDRYRKVEK